MARYASYLKDGVEAYGLAVEGGFATLGTGPDALLRALEAGPLPVALGADTGPAPAFLPLLRPPRLFCIGLNYGDHAREMAYEGRRIPGFFLKDPGTLVGHGGVLRVPAESEQLDWEGEIAVVIGRSGRRIPEAEALSHVSGYTCFSDGSVRDFQKQSTGAGKNFPDTAPLGPWLATAEAVGDPAELRLRTMVNGAVMQDAPLTQMLNPVSACIAYVSRITPLRPGDIIATGSPGGTGAGQDPPRWLRPGDLLEVEIDRVGRLHATVATEETG